MRLYGRDSSEQEWMKTNGMALFKFKLLYDFTYSEISHCERQSKQIIVNVTLTKSSLLYLAYYLQVPLFYLFKVVAPVQRFPVQDISHEEHLRAMLMDLASRPKTCYQIQGGGIFNYISNSTTTNNYFVGLC